MKTIRVPLYVIAEDEVQALLDLVTDVDGVVAAFLDLESAMLDVVVASDASALHVREQLATIVHAVPSF